MPKTVALIQARLGSTRLPMKSLLSLRDLPVMDWILRRVAKASLVDEIVVAVPDTALDTVLAEHVQRRGVRCFKGSENDVLDRFYQAGQWSGATQVVRICADNPLIWGGAIDALLRFYAQGGADYAYNHIPRNNTWPDGLGAETLSFELLAELWEKATRPEHREHCLSYIWDNAQSYRIATFEPEEAWLRRPELKLDMDTREDFCRLAHLPLHVDMGPQEIVRVWDAASAQTEGAA